jgi:hypothetical protein
MNKYILAISISILCLITSCKKDFLDPNPTDRISDENVWKSESLIEALLIDNYKSLSYGIFSFHGIYDDAQMLASLSDEVVSIWEEYDGRVKYVNGQLNADNVESGRFGKLGWRNQYYYITRANEFLSRIGATDALSIDVKNSYTGEMKALRAYRYFNLLKHFGGVPLIDKPFKLGEDYLAVKRASMDETVDFIVKELNESIDLLPATNTNERISKPVAQAFKSRVLLYAASPLYNPGNMTSRWADAAEAAKAVIESGKYSLEMDFEKYRKMFITYDPSSPEIILVKESSIQASSEYGSYELIPPLSHGTTGAGGFSYFAPTQQMVEAYEMNNGKPITDASSGYNTQDPYKNRDPRFYAFIYHHGAKLNNRALDYSVGGTDMRKAVYANPTGYNMRKFINEARFNADATAIISPNLNEPTPWIHFRYAEILLNYAEAINEAEGPTKAFEPINSIRARAGIPNLPSGLSQAEMRERIRNERRVELAFEEHRYWDVRRWKIAEQTENITVKGIQITKNDSAAPPTFEVVPADGPSMVNKRTFLSHQYFWPIMRSELLNNPNLTQNPGY